MDDLNNALSGILNDPESMKKVKELAENLLSGENGKNSEETSVFGGLNANELKAVTSVIGKLKSPSDDKRTALLLALKPNLSKRKQQKVDTAIKLLKLIEILPYLKESGILNIL